MDQKSHLINIFVLGFNNVTKIQHRNNVTTIRIKFNLTITTHCAKMRNDNTELQFEQFYHKN